MCKWILLLAGSTQKNTFPPHDCVRDEIVVAKLIVEEVVVVIVLLQVHLFANGFLISYYVLLLYRNIVITIYF